ncbi:hypothetical protein N0V90_007909 [Kalmusia sp. IMI 367209]|nr:hypothetical protein N0V90_007909 [Kalmusia sp. IMI 367209]
MASKRQLEYILKRSHYPAWAKQDDPATAATPELELNRKMYIFLIADRRFGRTRPVDVVEVDRSFKIVSPGFIDTHHHLWQTQLKGRHADHTVLDCMPSGNLSAYFFTPSDVFWGQLGGALEALDSGTTTVVDHAHMNYSAEHSDHALVATLASGIRPVFCYTPTPLVNCWQPRLSLAHNVVQPWHLSQINRFANLLATHSRVSIGFGFDGYSSLDNEDARSLFQEVRAAGVRCITSHYFRNPLFSQEKIAITLMADAVF